MNRYFSPMVYLIFTREVFMPGISKNRNKSNLVQRREIIWGKLGKLFTCVKLTSCYFCGRYFTAKTSYFATKYNQRLPKRTKILVNNISTRWMAHKLNIFCKIISFNSKIERRIFVTHMFLCLEYIRYLNKMRLVFCH